MKNFGECIINESAPLKMFIRYKIINASQEANTIPLNLHDLEE